MESDSAERSSVQKLTGPNYRSWARQMRIELIDRGVWSAIDPEHSTIVSIDKSGKEDPEPITSDEHKIQVAYLRDNRAVKLILAACSLPVIDRVIDLTLAKEVWEELRRMFARDGEQQLDSKNEAFASYMPPATTAVYDVASMLEKLQTDIAAINLASRPPDENKRSRFLAIMKKRGEDYRIPVAQAKLAKVTDFRDIVEMFADVEEDIKQTKAVTESARQASTDTEKEKGRWRSRGKEGDKEERFHQKDTRTCYHCGKTGHIRRNCASKKKGEPKATGPSTGLLAAPGGGRGLTPTPPEEANVTRVEPIPATETSWIAAVGDPNRVATNWVGSAQDYNSAWIMDSGCSRHMTFARSAFVSYTALIKPIPVRLANGSEIQSVGEGTVSFDIAVGGKKRRIQLHEVLHVPQLAGSLISVSHLQDRGIMTRTTSDGKMFLELKEQVIGVAVRSGRSYVLDGT